MNDFFKKIMDTIQNLWTKGTLVQKLIFFGVVGAVILALILFGSFTASPSAIAVYRIPISDPGLQAQIDVALSEKHINFYFGNDGTLYASSNNDAVRARALLSMENLTPSNLNDWEWLNTNPYTRTDFERKESLRLSITRELARHLEAYDFIDKASIAITMPEKSLFQEDQDPVTAAVQLMSTPGFNLAENRRAVEGVERFVRNSIPGLDLNNIVITDHNGIQVNDFESLSQFDDLQLSRRQLEEKRKIEQRLRTDILRELQSIFSPNRVRVINVDVEMDYSKVRSEVTEYSPIVMVENNPETPFSEREVVPSITLMEELNRTNFQGTGFIPQGAPGVESQTPSAYKDLENMHGTYQEESVRRNEAVNQRTDLIESTPWAIRRVNIAVAIDGIWRWTYNDRGEVLRENGEIVRDYTPVSNDQLTVARSLVQAAIGYNPARQDNVSVEHIQFDRTDDFRVEDDRYRRQQRIQQSILFSAIGLALILAIFIVARLIAREMERRRRLREEELSRQHQAMREAALKNAEEEGVDVNISVEERARMELQEHAINMAREHPEDVAQLIRTWLIEE